MSITVGELLLLLGVPTALMGFFVWLLKKWLEKKEKKREAKDKALIDILIAGVMSNNAALNLSLAIANAVARIPDAKCNGDMHDALEVAKKMKHELRELLTKLGVSAAIVD